MTIEEIFDVMNPANVYDAIDAVVTRASERIDGAASPEEARVIATEAADLGRVAMNQPVVYPHQEPEEA